MTAHPRAEKPDPRANAGAARNASAELRRAIAEIIQETPLRHAYSDALFEIATDVMEEFRYVECCAKHIRRQKWGEAGHRRHGVRSAGESARIADTISTATEASGLSYRQTWGHVMVPIMSFEEAVLVGDHSAIAYLIAELTRNA
jgi:hypothetical protein